MTEDSVNFYNLCHFQGLAYCWLVISISAFDWTTQYSHVQPFIFHVVNFLWRYYHKIMRHSLNIIVYCHAIKIMLKIFSTTFLPRAAASRCAKTKCENKFQNLILIRTSVKLDVKIVQKFCVGCFSLKTCHNNMSQWSIIKYFQTSTLSEFSTAPASHFLKF